MKHISRHTGVTLIELLVVILIISILSTIATGVYTQQLGKAREARTRTEIRTLEVAIGQYYVDTGQYPPTGSGTTIAPNDLTVTPGTYDGSGYLTLALRTSLNANPQEPLSNRWRGPYVEWDMNRMGNLAGLAITTEEGEATPLGAISFLDPYGMPYLYIRSDDYEDRGGTELPPNNPFSASEIYFNPSTFQIISRGPNRQTLAPPQRGMDEDDITNFLSPEF